LKERAHFGNGCLGHDPSGLYQCKHRPVTMLKAVLRKSPGVNGSQLFMDLAVSTG